MKSNILKRLSALAMTAVMAFSISGGVSAADAATATIDTGRSKIGRASCRERV